MDKLIRQALKRAYLTFCFGLTNRPKQNVRNIQNRPSLAHRRHRTKSGTVNRS